jgi:hypothetical protein
MMRDVSTSLDMTEGGDPRLAFLRFNFATKYPLRLTPRFLISANCAETHFILVAGIIHYRGNRKREWTNPSLAARFSAHFSTTRQSANSIADRELRQLEHMPLLSSSELRQLARLVSSHHDSSRNGAKFA